MSGKKRERDAAEIAPHAAAATAGILAFPMEVLATVLSPAWEDAGALIWVCRRFYAAVRRREFWMPAVRAALEEECPATHRHLIAQVDPFFCFPKRVSTCPPWPWWCYLDWLIRPDNGSMVLYETIDDDDRIHLAYKTEQMLCFFSNDSGTKWIYWFIDYDADAREHPPVSCMRVDTAEGDVEYEARVNGRIVWHEGTLRSGKRWRGAVRAASGDEFRLLTGYGQYY